MSLLAPTLQAFFTDRLITQRDVSPRTVAAYRDTFRLLLAFVEQQTGKQPYQLDLADLDAPLIGAFLTHLEQGRHNTPRTRNARLAAIHSFYRYAALRHPEHLATIARIMAIPTKRHQRNDLTYLTKPEIEALVHAPDQATWLGRRDHTMLLTMITTGVRVSELIAINVSDVTLTPGAQHLKVHGKGRKNRTTPLKAETATALRAWLHERAGAPHEPLFPTRQGHHLHRQTVALLVAKHAHAAAARCPSLATKRISPHTLRHYVERLGYVAGWRVCLAGPVAEPGSGHIIRGSVLVGLVDGPMRFASPS